MSEIQNNTILVGDKPPMTYIVAIQTQSLKYDEIYIKSRGTHNSRAIDVAEIAVKKYMKNWRIEEIKTDSINKPSKTDDKVRNVSIITILLKKKTQDNTEE